MFFTLDILYVISVRSKNLSMKYRRFTQSSFKDQKIRKFLCPIELKIKNINHTHQFLKTCFVKYKKSCMTHVLFHVHQATIFNQFMINLNFKVNIKQTFKLCVYKFLGEYPEYDSLDFVKHILIA